jgi:hypothetical protein
MSNVIRTRGAVAGTVQQARLETPLRVPGSVRRTTTIDVIYSGTNADPDRPAQVISRGRDASTRDGSARDASRRDGELDVWDECEVRGTLARDRTLLTIEGGPAELRQLVGRRVAGGFRAALAAAVGPLSTSGSVLYQTMDDWPGAALVAGQAAVDVRSTVDDVDRELQASIVAANTDLCSGWAADAQLVATYRKNNVIHLSLGPPSPDLTRPDDPQAFNEFTRLLPGDSRRSRRLDLIPHDGYVEFDVHFRDAWVGIDELERVTHEYTVAGNYDPVDEVITSLTSTAHVLPWPECPAAAASAMRVIGLPLDDLRAVVRRDFVGTTTCTHLNDVVRSLADLPVLARRLTGSG